MRVERQGQSMVEIILALALFALIAGSLAALLGGSVTGFVESGEVFEATLHANEGLEAARAIRDRAWNELRFATSAVSFIDGAWEFVGEGSVETSGGFSRTVSIHDVCRDSSDEFVSCPGAYRDLHTRRIESRATWSTRPGITEEVVYTSVLSNWDSRDWMQTDWSGGAGQSVWGDPSRYDVASSSLDTDTAGEVVLGSAGEGSWDISGGTEVLDTTDADFSQGTFTDTTVSDFGIDASVTLAFGNVWGEHADSGSTGNDFNAAYFLSDDEIWSVGNAGVIFFYDGVNWAEFQDVGSRDLEGVYMTSQDDGWAVGRGGEIYHYNGSAWSLHTDTGNENWNDVSCASPSNCWAGGNGGKLAFFDGLSWSESRITAPSNIYGLYALAASDVWAVGSSGRIWHYDGGAWTLSADTGNEVWEDVACASSSDCWAVGNNGAAADYDGTSWSEMTITPSENIMSVYVLDSSDIWAAGLTGLIYHYDGDAWALYTDTGNEHWNAIVMSASSGFVLGRNGEIFEFGQFYADTGSFMSRIFDSGEGGTVWNLAFWTEVLTAGSDVTIATRTGDTLTPDGSWSRWSGELTDPTGSQITSPSGRYFQYRLTLVRGASQSETPELLDVTVIYGLATSENITGVSAVSVNDVWAVGTNGVILHYDGDAWALHTDTGGEAWEDVSCASQTSCVAVERGEAAAHYDGAGWSVVAVPDSTAMNGVFARAPDDVWAVGISGRIWHYDGDAWALYTDTGNERWNDIVCTSSADCWTAGDGGALASFDGADWSVSALSPAGDVFGLYAVSASDIWAAGAGGNIYHYDGDAWALHTDTGGETWNDITFSTGSNGWVLGDGGIIFHYNGAGWSSFPSPASRDIHSTAAPSETDAWAVGDRGTILRFTGGILETRGYLVSSAFSMGDPSPVQIIEWDEVIPPCSPACLVRLQVQTAPDAGGAPGVWGAWAGTDGAGSYFLDASGEIISVFVNGGEWVRYRAELRGDGVDTPILEEVRINYK